MFLIKTTIFKSICITCGLTTLIVLIVSLSKAVEQSKPIVFKTQNYLSVPVEIDRYLELIDGDRTQLKTPKYLIRRRLNSFNDSRLLGGKIPTQNATDSGKQRGTHHPHSNLYTLYLDVYNLEGKLLGTRVHNLAVVK